jgi:hypothetical protein
MSSLFQKANLTAKKPVSISTEERITQAEDPFHALAEVLQKQIHESSYDELIEALSDKTMLAGIAYRGSLCSGTWLARQVLGLGEYDKAITEALRSDQIVYIPTPPHSHSFLAQKT